VILVQSYKPVEKTKNLLTYSSLRFPNNPVPEDYGKCTNFRRALNAAFLVRDVPIIRFLYRVILAMIRGDKILRKTNKFYDVEMEFKSQFGEEFGFTAQELMGMITVELDWDLEWSAIESNVFSLERIFPLACWLRG
jgi:hypothetical protein